MHWNRWTRSIRLAKEPYPLLQPTQRPLWGGACPARSYSVGVRREASQRAKDCGLSPLRRPASRPSTPICSSRSGHSIAYPSPSNCQCCRSASDPCTRRVIRRILCVRKPRLVTRATGSGQNLATYRSRCIWMCGGSPRSELKKMQLYGPSRSTVGIEPHFWHACFYTRRKDFTRNREK